MAVADPILVLFALTIRLGEGPRVSHHAFVAG
jgi:hypothetical protein